jgi:hypothetical protein
LENAEQRLYVRIRNDRLILIETLSFTTSPDDMMEALTGIIADRSDGALFFGNYYLMDYELMGGDARAAIVAESAKLGTKPFPPPVARFGSKQWPMRITPGAGAQFPRRPPINRWDARDTASPARSISYESRTEECVIVNNPRRIYSGNSGNPCNSRTGANNDGASRSDSRASTHSAADATES